VGVIATILVVNLLAMPRFFNAGDPFTWREEARSILRTGSLSIDSTHAAAFGEPGQFFVINHSNGLWYSKYGLMNSIMSIPPTFVEASITGRVLDPNEISNIVVFNLYNILLCLLVAVILLAITGQYTQSSALRAAYVLACFYATYFWFYQRAQSSEIYQVLFFALFFLLLTRALRRPLETKLFLGAWACLAALILTRLAFAVLLVVPAVMILQAAWARPAAEGRKPFHAFILATIPPLLILALLAWINDVKFGSAFLTGYHQWHVEDHRITSNLADGVYGFLFSVRWGIFFYFPVLLLAIPGVRLFATRHPADAIIAIGSFVLLLLAVGSIPSWRGEWTYGPRYLIAVLPILSLPAICFAEKMLSWRLPLTAMAMTATAAVLLFSTWLQYQVNRLDFWAVHHMAGPFEKSGMDMYLFRYLNDHVEGVILHDLVQHQGHLQGSELIKRVAETLAPSAVQQYQAYVTHILEETNWYWWPPSTKKDAAPTG
jgi:hypothetical protein